MNNALTVIAQNTGVSADEITDVLKGMIISAKNQHGATATNAEMAIVTGVCAKYDLNPLVKECTAFISGGKLQVVVMIDGWYRIVNRQPDFDGVEFEDKFDENGKIHSTTCKMYLKNRSHPVVVTEYFDECNDPRSSVWKRWPARMLRHKAYIQDARMAFGISEMIDDDEASRYPEQTQNVTPHTEKPDLSVIKERMDSCQTHDELAIECKAIAQELRELDQFQPVKADLTLMKREREREIDEQILDVEPEPENEFGDQ